MAYLSSLMHPLSIGVVFKGRNRGCRWSGFWVHSLFSGVFGLFEKLWFNDSVPLIISIIYIKVPPYPLPPTHATGTQDQSMLYLRQIRVIQLEETLVIKARWQDDWWTPTRECASWTIWHWLDRSNQVWEDERGVQISHFPSPAYLIRRKWSTRNHDQSPSNIRCDWRKDSWGTNWRDQAW